MSGPSVLQAIRQTYLTSATIANYFRDTALDQYDSFKSNGLPSERPFLHARGCEGEGHQ